VAQRHWADRLVAVPNPDALDAAQAAVSLTRSRSTIHLVGRSYTDSMPACPTLT
jgi:hypothetical protein